MNILYSLLLQLPDSIIRKVIQKFDWPKLITFSLYSPKSRELVRSLNFKADSFKVHIGNKISIWIAYKYQKIDLDFFANRWENQEPRVELEPPEFTELSIPNGRLKIYKKEYEMKDWVDHFLYIFHTSKIMELQLSSNRYDINSLYKNFDKVTTLICSLEDRDIYNKEFIETFKNVENLYNAGRFLYEGRETECHQILMRNYTCLDFFHSTTLGLDELLMINSINCTFFYESFTEKEMNMFLKHWIKGSNPRLECLFTHSKRGVGIDEKCLLRGIEYTEAPASREKIFHINDVPPESYFVEGGVDIKRKDGKMATLIISYTETSVPVQMFVWQ
ncbi:hypothetical protein CRE_29344 [Caenorhabditis remanei]|uniref:F-box domain-containing protein n=1 Tax=Caenorhabditis remanei TaxID=31234 RepID=E3MY01_CAERE|nr:hypothetical protein CRE_29344 [Caenorhabditis remanei]